MKCMAHWVPKDTTEQTPLCPHSPYSASKTSADMVVMAYHDTYKMPVTITRCSITTVRIISRKVDSADYQEYSGRKEASCLW